MQLQVHLFIINRYRFPNPISSKRDPAFFPSRSPARSVLISWTLLAGLFDRGTHQCHVGLQSSASHGLACIGAGVLWQGYRAVGSSQTSAGWQLLHLSWCKCQLKARSSHALLETASLEGKQMNEGRTLGDVCWSSCRPTEMTLKSSAVLPPELCSRLVGTFSLQLPLPGLSSLGCPVPQPGAGLHPPSTCRHSMEVRLEQSQSRKLGFFLDSWVNCVQLWAGAWSHSTGKQTLLCWWGEDGEASPCEGIFSSFAISAHSSLHIEGFILVLIHFQRKASINEICTWLCFKCPWGQYYCHCVWKPHRCQRTSTQQDCTTRCFGGGDEWLENRWWNGNWFSETASPFAIPMAAINAVFS